MDVMVSSGLFKHQACNDEHIHESKTSVHIDLKKAEYTLVHTHTPNQTITAWV